MNDTKEKHATHTPGPWVISKVIKHGARCYRTIRQEGKFKLAEVFAFNECATGTKEGKAEDAANARLIAAAPKMYEILQEVVESMELAKSYGYEKEARMKQANANVMIQKVLAKVDGGEG